MNIAAFQQKILHWYAQHRRNLPWRTTTNPYHILVSEIMLQQTQVDRVIPYYQKWLKSFPDLKTLKKASKESLLSHWSGLGYNSRVIRLQQLAKTTNALPATEAELLKLPGIGPYTARAILAFAHNKSLPVIDTNIRRVLIWELCLAENIPLKELENIAMLCIPKNKSRIWHNALMDYGALEVTAKKTQIKPTSKQSIFKGSDREVRGFIVKQLLKNTITLSDVRIKFPNKDVLPIVKKLEQEGTIYTKCGKLLLKE